MFSAVEGSFQMTQKTKDSGKGGRPHISSSSSSAWSASSSWAALRWNLFKSSQIFHEGVSFNLLPAEVCLRCEGGLKCSDEWSQKQPLPQRFHNQTSVCSLHLKRLKNTSENSVYYCTCERSNLCMSVCVRPSVCVCALLATWCGQLMYASMLVFLVCVMFHSRSLNLFWFLAAFINHSNLEPVRLW